MGLLINEHRGGNYLGIEEDTMADSQPELTETVIRLTSAEPAHVPTAFDSHPLFNLLPSELLANLSAASKHKARSRETHEQVHLPVLRQEEPIRLLLLGDSMFERFKTTGIHTAFGPSNAPYPTVFNAGVGGDRISNVVYRLVRPDGLLDCLATCGGAEYVFLEMGTNDLGEGKKPLREQDVEMYRLVVEALSVVCGERLKAVVVCGLNMKKRVKRVGVVEESNEMLRGMAERTDVEWERNGCDIEYLAADSEIIDHLEEDGVHLDEKGYNIFAARLGQKYEELRRRLEAGVPSKEKEEKQ